MDKRFFNEKKKFGGGINIMVWGMISNEGPETINWINEHGEKLNSSGYIELLSDDYILSTIKQKGKIF